MKVILGKKLHMTQQFLEDGTVIPVTVVQAGPCVVTQVKTAEKDGYTAIQLGFGEKKRLAKPQIGHLKDLPKAAVMKEFRFDSAEVMGEIKRGDTLSVEQFTAGDKVSVTGTSKGRGFQGVVKRHGFGGSPATHGHKDQLRMPGSIGSTGPARVFKGKRMPGRMGNEQVTVRNLEIVGTDAKDNLLFIKGAVPGARNSLVSVTVLKEAKVAQTA